MIEVRVCVIEPVDLHQDCAEAVHLRGVFEEVARRRHSVIFIGTRAHVETGSLVHECAVLVPKIGGIWGPMFWAKNGGTRSRDRSNLESSHRAQMVPSWR